MKTVSAIPYKKIAGNKLFLMVLVLLTLILYATTFVKYSTFMNELTLLFSTESDGTVTYIMEILTGIEFQVISRFFTIFFSLYAISFILWLISRLDEVIFDSPKEIKFSYFTNAYLYSLYVVLFDLIFQTIYMNNITDNEMPSVVLPYYTGVILFLQCVVLLFLLGVRKNKLYITSSIMMVMVSAVVFALIYFSEVGL
ncbi:hypothetical protein [Peribacillus frigoritolerans]|uniref:hypothetical protein n=1 Tax=Peribacillus frigoritolerans TaxID=450367 RepID=UPI002162A297|nr:hypothetical protein [Peribacillus frigoritolerans]